MCKGVAPLRAAEVAVSKAVTDDEEVQRAISELVATIFVV